MVRAGEAMCLNNHGNNIFQRWQVKKRKCHWWFLHPYIYPSSHKTRSLSRVFQQLKDQYVFSFLEIINSSKQWPRVYVTRYYCNRSSLDLIPCQRQSEQLICYFYRDFVNSGDENHDNVSDCVTRAHPSIMCWLTENNQLIDNHLDVCVLHNELSESQNDKQKYTRDTWCSGSVKQMVV